MIKIKFKISVDSVIPEKNISGNVEISLDDKIKDLIEKVLENFIDEAELRIHNLRYS